MTSPPPGPSYPVKVYRRRARAVRAVQYSAPYAWVEVAQFLGSTTGHKVGACQYGPAERYDSYDAELYSSD